MVVNESLRRLRRLRDSLILSYIKEFARSAKNAQMTTKKYDFATLKGKNRLVSKVRGLSDKSLVCHFLPKNFLKNPQFLKNSKLSTIFLNTF